MGDKVWLYLRESDDYLFSVHRTKEGAEAKLRKIESYLQGKGVANTRIRIEERELEP